MQFPEERESNFCVDLRSYDNSNYDPGPLFRRVSWYLVSRAFFQTFVPWPSSLKSAILRLFGASVGEGLVIKPMVRIKYPWLLEIGEHCWIGEGAWLDTVGMITLESNVTISQDALLITGNHDYRSESFDLRVEPITVEEGAWVAARATVSPGRTIGRNAVLVAGAVLLENAKSGGVYAGNPARMVRSRLRES